MQRERIRRVFGQPLTRRQTLKGISALAGTALLGSTLPACGDDDGTSPANSESASLQPEELAIETVVMVMMENRSFDHYFGALSLEERRAADGLRATFTNPRPDGTRVSPFRLDPRCVADPRHGWDASRRQVNGGRNDGFVREHYDAVGPSAGDQVMGYHNRAQLPFIYGLADEFVICDRWFCSVLGPTWPNRFYLHSAQSNGRMNNAFPETGGGFTWRTIYDSLAAAGIDWRYYYIDLPFLTLFSSVRRQNRFADIRQFFEDARSGTLPPVVVVDPGFQYNDDHPPHDIHLGQAFISSIVHALGQSPQWSRSMLILTYDEHGGFFDHVPPPQVEDERAVLGFNQLGVRVPGVIVSPFTRRGVVSSTLYEHSSFPAFIEWLFGLEPLTVRDANANVFLDTFDVGRVRRNDPRAFPALPVIEVESEIPAECIPFDPIVPQDIGLFADAGGVPAALDLRSSAPDAVRAINRELLRMGGARPRH
jgi:phospholipase C